MAKNNQKKELANMEENFPQWYTDIIRKADLADYSPVKGFMVIKPYGFAIWENIQDALDNRFKETGHQNMYFPLLIPETLLEKEKEHVEGFAPEVAWVTKGGDKELNERLVVRPTSETLITTMYGKWLNSYRQLPFLYNQWCSVVRWEKTTRPFLRTSEFLWQEGHTLHETAEEAQEETLKMLDIYREILEDYMAVPVVTGRKSPKETFAGAEQTYTVEALMHDGQALQSGTSHNFGTKFTSAYDVTFLDRNNEQTNPFQTSWGFSTRVIGALIMVHGDENGLVIPPKIAPIQTVIIPIQMNKEGVLDKAYELRDRLKDKVRIQIDETDNSPGWKFNEWELKGVPVRIELGPRDLKNNQAVLARRDTGEKITVDLDELDEKLIELLDQVQENLFNKALEHRENRTSAANNMDEFKENLEENPGFVRAMWCGDQACEDHIKDETGATLRCIPFDQNKEGIEEDTCVYCGKHADEVAYFARAY